MASATVVAPLNAGPTFAELYEEADRMLDQYLESQRAIDRAVLAGFDRDEPVDLDLLIAAVSP